jgi:hypothetical protein
LVSLGPILVSARVVYLTWRVLRFARRVITVNVERINRIPR